MTHWEKIQSTLDEIIVLSNNPDVSPELRAIARQWKADKELNINIFIIFTCLAFRQRGILRELLKQIDRSVDLEQILRFNKEPK